MKTKNCSQEIPIDVKPQLQFSEVRFQRILVAMNDTNSVSPVFEKAISMAQKHDSHLMLFYCLDSLLSKAQKIMKANSMSLWSGISSVDMIESSEQLHPQLVKGILNDLRSRHQQAQELGIPTEFDYTIAEPGKAICQLGKSWGADLIILEEQKRSGLAKFFLQSVSDYVVSHAGCSVITVTSHQLPVTSYQQLITNN